MSAAEELRDVSVENYLAGELHAQRKHEFVDGRVYAMAGGTLHHSRIAGNAFGALYSQLKGVPCSPYNSDTKIRAEWRGKTYFYYPDMSVVCDSELSQDTYQDRPTLICEVLSRSTSRIDDGEKREVYCQIPSLRVYLLVSQSEPVVKIYRRSGEDFVPEIITGLDAVIPLPEIGAELRLTDLYEGIEFIPVSDEEEP